jgi:hypothetical protein
MAINGIDFRQIVPRFGDQREAFEELCCQLAFRYLPREVDYKRMRGAGGDGGVECFADLPDGTQIGWQAKYLFDIDSLITQATLSLETALTIHPTLSHYIICFPFNLTGPTGRRGRSGQEKFDQWKKAYEDKAASEGRQLSVDPWSESTLLSLLLDHDASGGLRAFFFNQTVLSDTWFSTHLDAVRATAGPRYTPELNVETELWKWFASFGRTPLWSSTLDAKVRQCVEPYNLFASQLNSTGADQFLPIWPSTSREDTQSLASVIPELLNRCRGLTSSHDPREYKQCTDHLENALDKLRSLESKLLDDLEAKNGPGSDSPGFRQYMAEYMVSFPAANLDSVRELVTACNDLVGWLKSPSGCLAFEKVFVLSGIAGSGKTHGICDAAHYRFREGFLSCVAFGHAFKGEPNPGARLLECFRMPPALGLDGCLDALNSAAEASGSLLIIFIDAINETRPLRYWRDYLAEIVQEIQNRPFLSLCVTCRTSFLSYCLPQGHNLPIIEHHGFAGVERNACKAFFEYYNLRPPIMPILQPELSNPLYLKLICETIRARGLDRIPSGWYGLAPAIRAFLDVKEQQFADEHETSVGAKIINRSLRTIARTIANSGESSLSWSRAYQVVCEEIPRANTLPALEWLTRADLLIEDAPSIEETLSEESFIRPAFERLGDFLVASELMDMTDPSNLEMSFRPGGSIYPFISDQETIEKNAGVVGALSVLLPEKYIGRELPNVLDGEQVRTAAIRITVNSLPWRDCATFSRETELLIHEALRLHGFAYEAMDAVLSLSWLPSIIDAIWLDGLLKAIPMARRDAFWCGYLYDRYESFGPLRRFIDAAFELPLDQIEWDVAERWTTALLLFTAAADHRVKDWATRAAIAVLINCPEIIPAIIHRMLDNDDDEMKERVLIGCYGSLIISRNADVTREVINILHQAFLGNPFAFDNALIRDDIRCLMELAVELDALPDDCNPNFIMSPIGSDWPLVLPTDEEVKQWEQLPKLAFSCLEDDFFVYSMNCLRPWEHGMSKKNMGKWILQQIVNVFGYEGSGCEDYDEFTLGRYGGGRARNVWAERIGKKYQWVAMYQLASRLFDHIERKQDPYSPEPLRTPLILLEERKIDPTLPPNIVTRARDADAWWIGSSTNLRLGEQLPDDEWVTMQEDLPALERLLSVIERDGQRWRLLVSYPTWGKRDEEADRDASYRQVWMHVESYLVPKQEIEIAYKSLHHRNFFGQWMPEGATWSYGFAGEYPWGTAFNTEPEEWHGRGLGQRLPFRCMPSYSSITVEWEYDASIQQNLNMIVPARIFFKPKDLWVDGQSGYRLINGNSVFRDPSILEIGPRALIADADDILIRLDKLGLRLIWTVLGEKWILGGRDPGRTPRRTFSQIALLGEDGSIQFGDRVFFGDYDKDVGPLVSSSKRRLKH